MSISTKLTAAALAGLFSATVMTAGAAFAEDKAADKGADTAAEKHECKGGAKAGCHSKDTPEANKCTGKDADGKDADGKAHCAGKDEKAK